MIYCTTPDHHLHLPLTSERFLFEVVQVLFLGFCSPSCVVHVLCLDKASVQFFASSLKLFTAADGSTAKRVRTFRDKACGCAQCYLLYNGSEQLVDILGAEKIITICFPKSLIALVRAFLLKSR